MVLCVCVLLLLPTLSKPIQGCKILFNHSASSFLILTHRDIPSVLILNPQASFKRQIRYWFNPLIIAPRNRHLFCMHNVKLFQAVKSSVSTAGRALHTRVNVCHMCLSHVEPVWWFMTTIQPQPHFFFFTIFKPSSSPLSSLILTITLVSSPYVWGIMGSSSNSVYSMMWEQGERESEQIGVWNIVCYCHAKHRHAATSRLFNCQLREVKKIKKKCWMNKRSYLGGGN